MTVMKLVSQQHAVKVIATSVLNRQTYLPLYNYSITRHRPLSCDMTSPPRHIVYVSRSKCIFENLALEDWLYENGDLDSCNYLLMWKNRPAVVFGRHQNPWMECDLKRITTKLVDLARRKSGGGAVYHDMGNLNLSFIKSRQRYCRRDNLELVVRAIASQWNVDLSINKREDIILDGLFKISGTASKLGGKRTYHHFTLLVDVDVERLYTLLQSPMMDIRSRSTESVRAHVRNLVESAPTMTYTPLVQCIGNHFLLHNKAQGDSGIQVIDTVTDERFPGVAQKVAEFKHWEWTFGKTPPFSIVKSFTSSQDGQTLDLNLKVDIIKGRIHKTEFELLNEHKVPINISHYRPYFDQLNGQCFDSRVLNPVFENIHMNFMAVSGNNVVHACWILKCLKLCLLVD